MLVERKHGCRTCSNISTSKTVSKKVTGSRTCTNRQQSTPDRVIILMPLKGEALLSSQDMTLQCGLCHGKAPPCTHAEQQHYEQ